MKIPHSVQFFPLEIKKDKETKSLWVYIPEWIVRAFKLKACSNAGKIMIEIHRDNRTRIEYKDSEILNKFWHENWKTKMRRERRQRTDKQ
jgi:ribosomal protein S18